MELSTELPPHYKSWNQLYDELLRSVPRLEYMEHIYVYRAYENCNVITAGHLPDHNQQKYSVRHIVEQALLELKGKQQTFTLDELRQLKAGLQSIYYVSMVPEMLNKLEDKLRILIVQNYPKS